MNDMKMSGAELKVRLTGLGLTPNWLADHIGVSVRTVHRWCNEPVAPYAAAAAVWMISQRSDEELGRLIEQAHTTGVIRTQRTDRDIPHEQAALHLPAAWHRAIASKALEHARAAGITVTVSH